MRIEGPWGVERAHRVVLAVAVCLVSSHATAQQPSAAEVATARQFGIEGLRLASEGKCAEAIEPLQRAERIYSAPTTLEQLGECQIALGKLVAGTEALQRVARAELPPNASQAFRAAREKAKKLLDETLPKLAKLRISVAPAGVDAKVTLDGALLPSTLLDADEPADPGRHVVQATATGMLTASAEVTLAEGGREAVTLTLKPDPNAAPPAAKPAPAETSSSAAPVAIAPAPKKPASKVLPYSLLGVGVVGIGVGTAFGLMARSHKADLDATCMASKVCPLSSKGEYDTASSDATWSTVGFGVGIAALAVGTVLLLTTGEPPAQQGRTTRSITVSSGPGELGAGLGGAF